MPGCLSDDDVNEILQGYLISDVANTNYVRAIVAWPSNCKVKLSKETIVEARRLYRRQTEDLGINGVHLSPTVQIGFNPDQAECVRVRYSTNAIDYSYCGDWLLETLDYPSVLSNYIYVFGLFTTDKLLSMPSNGRHSTTFLSKLMRPRTEYVQNEESRLEQAKQACIAEGYNKLLRSNGASIEGAVEWFFNEYISREYGIEGFRIAMSSEGTSYREKCRIVGPAIERVIKSFLVFVMRGFVDSDYYSLETFGGFENVPSLMSDKYVTGFGNEYEGESSALFSDQSSASLALD